MANYGYTNLNEKHFLSFSHNDLPQGAWGSIDAKEKSDPANLDEKGLTEVSLFVVWKIWIIWAISQLTEALGLLSTAMLEKLDNAWDSGQRQLYHQIAYFEAEADEALRRAAKILRDAMLLGDGLAQTKLAYDDEVDWGYMQLSLAKEKVFADAIALLGLGHIFDKIKAATDALAKGLGRAPGEKRLESRSRRIENAVRECRSTFGLIHRTIDKHLKTTPPGPTRDFLEQLREPLLEMLARGAEKAEKEEKAKKTQEAQKLIQDKKGSEEKPKSGPTT